MNIAQLESSHWPQVHAVYAAGIATGNATFETKPPNWEGWDATHRPDLRLVALDGSDVAGWAAVWSVSERCCYAGVVEHSVYVADSRRGQGVGRHLLDALVGRAEEAGVWTIQTGIFPENEASVALHLRCEFRVVGRRERLGQLAGLWRDVLLLERRSPRIT